MNNLPMLSFSDCKYEDSKIVITGAPFDGTTSFRPGTRFGIQAMRDDFLGLESYSPVLDRDLADINIFDRGDLEFPFGNTQAVIDCIYKETSQILKGGKIPFLIGGEHLVSLGSIRACYEKYSDLHVVHLDAHTDLRDDYLGEKLSHATVLRRVWDFLGDNKIYQFGIRSGTKEEFIWADSGHVSTTKYNLDGIENLPKKLIGCPVYVTVDLDVLDPSLMSGTGTPEAGGIFFKELEKLFYTMQNLNVIGCDIVELSPTYDSSGVSTAVACKTLREMLLSIK